MSIDMLREEFSSIYEYENRAKYFYEHFIDQIKDKDIKHALTMIRNDEKTHIKMAERLMAIIEEV